MIAPSCAMSLDLYLSSLALPDDVPCCTSLTSGRMSGRRPLCQAGPFAPGPQFFRATSVTWLIRCIVFATTSPA